MDAPLVRIFAGEPDLADLFGVGLGVKAVDGLQADAFEFLLPLGRFLQNLVQRLFFPALQLFQSLSGGFFCFDRVHKNYKFDDNLRPVK